ncbi:hypothetical protein LXL04_033162 [Taraxacum kok-saghyz]
MMLLKPFLVVALCLLTNVIDCVCARELVERETTSPGNNSIDLPTVFKSAVEIETRSINVGDNATELQIFFLGLLKDLSSSENPIETVINNLTTSIEKTIEIQTIAFATIFRSSREIIFEISRPSINLSFAFDNAAEIEKATIVVFNIVTELQNAVLAAPNDLDSSANPIGKVDENLATVVRITLDIQNLTRRIVLLARRILFIVSETSINPDEVRSNVTGMMISGNTQETVNGMLNTP